MEPYWSKEASHRPWRLCHRQTPIVSCRNQLYRPSEPIEPPAAVAWCFPAEAPAAAGTLGTVNPDPIRHQHPRQQPPAALTATSSSSKQQCYAATISAAGSLAAGPIGAGFCVSAAPPHWRMSRRMSPPTPPVLPTPRRRRWLPACILSLHLEPSCALPSPPPKCRRDYYDLLQVPRSATDAQIKRAYRKLALKMHPDKVQGSEEEKKEAAQKFADVSHGGCWPLRWRTARKLATSSKGAALQLPSRVALFSSRL